MKGKSPRMVLSPRQSVFKSPLSKMILSPRMHPRVRSPSSSEGASSSAAVNANRGVLAGIDLNMPPVDENEDPGQHLDENEDLG